MGLPRISRLLLLSARLPARRFQSTHFGFQNVPENEKSGRVHTVFENVASKYDLMNDLMSGGIHRLWKDYFVDIADPHPNWKCVDVAGGTGDIAFRLARHAATKGPLEENLIVYDINQKMLDVGEYRAEIDSALPRHKFQWVCGDAEDLPFEANSFDLYTIAFGIRNCTHLERVLEEAHRVLKPGGRFACLEFSKIHSSLRSVYDLYSFQVIPMLGKAVTNDYESYKYLVESIRMFPNQEEFSQMIRDAGFSRISYQNLTFGMNTKAAAQLTRCVLCNTNTRLDYKNARLLQQFVSSFSGRVYEQHITGLCNKQYKLLLQTVELSRKAGFMPVLAKDPKYLRDPKLFDPLRPIRPHSYA
ncbi:2-methoxy-6-polyprenyl-1,4-benzoquinol methylase, mitochondrial [Aphelenchoides fujianensis]|nr:2-methoxy-6-polyprenyl-1,4-benzoquinol methylase, mitochondrial [Aphelenchoides fujianensis]